MSTPTFAETHNLVAFLEKPAESAGFEQIIDFLKSKPIHYALTVNPTIYVSCVKQFWAMVKVKKVNGQDYIQALFDKEKVIITEDIIRSYLRFDDVEGTACLLNEETFEGLARMGFLQVFLDKQVEGMLRHKEMYIISSHTKKIFANIRRIGAGFFRVIAPLFDTMMVQAAADMGDTPVETHQTPIVDQPSTSLPQKKQKPRRKQRNKAEVSHDESQDEDHVPTPSNDPLPSGEDSFTLNELMVFCTNLQEHVLDLQEAKDAQAKEIASLKKKVTKLNKWRKSRSRGLRRLKKVGPERRVKSSMQKDSLGAKEDASKQGRMIEEINQNAKISLDADTQRRINDDEMFGVDDLAGEVVMDTTTGEHEEQIIEDVSTAEPVTTAGEVVTTTVVKVSAAPTTDVTEDEITMAQALAALKSTKPKVVVQVQEISTTIPASATKVTTAVLIPKAKGIVFHEQNQSQIPTISSLKDKGKAKMIEPKVPIKKKDQMRIDEEEEFSKVQKARLLVELIEKRKKRFAALRAQEKRNKPHTKTQMRSQMSTYLKHMGGYKQSYLKGRSYDEIKKLFDREMRKVDENVEPVIDDTKDLKKYMEIVPDDGDEVLIEATPLSSRSPTTIDYKIHKEGKKIYFKIIRADGNSQLYQTFEKMFKNFNREDLEVLTLKTMFEHHVEAIIWTYQQGLAKVKNWKLYESCEVYCITMQSTIYYLLVEKVYPLTRNTLHQLWSDVRLHVDHDAEMAYDLLRFLKKQIMEGYTL
uniref:Xylulose kinase-1 n=1 Tax=Tanacetum cinerariifolium TaxID=118510 RepID=A0A6L2LH14_TANCI|nr:hypothetical protein [Tanacetum cinerariifolium]